MSDPRSTPFNGQTAHVSLRGQVAAERFVEGHDERVVIPVADLCRTAGGSRDRQLILGEAFTVLDQSEDWSFGMASRDGYVGWIETAALSPSTPEPTHVISAHQSYAKSTTGLKPMGTVTPLSLGSRLTVLSETEGWADIYWEGDRQAHVSMQHLTQLPWIPPDPVALAERYLGAPYLWGGNSSFGLDCSALVQSALQAVGIPCSGDSDRQAASFGAPLPDDDPIQRGDLLFWKGHVAMAVDAEIMIHASAHFMAVVYEPIADAIARIERQGDGPMTTRKRPR
ncbi:MAG: C40 family peptidase [Rhodobacteraceae bacterium]|nr:C40 family peptidase [Paracoccaceae bacterium]